MANTDVTVQAIIDNSLARAKDPDKTQWTDAQMVIFINKAQNTVQKTLIRIGSELVISEDTITMLAATQEYLLADNLADFWGMTENGVYFSAIADPLVPVLYEDKQRAGTDTTDTYPESYYVTNLSLGVIDIPTATSAASYPTLNCRYFKKNTPLTLAGNMPYNNLFNDAMSSYADYVAVLKTTAQTSEYTALLNALEEQTLAIASKRTPI